MMNSRSEFFNYFIENPRERDSEEAKKFVVTDLEKFCYNSAFHKTFDVSFDVHKEFEKLFNKYCNCYGKSDTVIGEIIRGLMKVCYRYMNDGDDIETGSYSGIWYGLKEKLDCPFIAYDGGVNYYDYDLDGLNPFSCVFGRDYISNIALNALIIETFEDLHYNNRVDIAEYYDNIVNFLIPAKFIKTFEDNGIIITHNFGDYDYSYDHGNSTRTINSITEDMSITFDLCDNIVDIKYNPCMKVKFKLSLDFGHVDEILPIYGDLLRYITHLATVDYKKSINYDTILKDLKNIGFQIKDGYISKIEEVT